ncbi:MAG: ASCH domain-containing protein [Pseudomonadota bacterium]
MSAELPDKFQVRWIGGDANSTAAILQHIRDGNKTGTVSVPEAVAASGQQETKPGNSIILLNFDGTPALVVQVAATEVVAGDINDSHTALDGPQVRALDVWMPVHKGYFDRLLSPFGKSCTDSRPISFEAFHIVYNT